MYAPLFVDTARLPNNSSIIFAELYALLLVLQKIQSHKSSKFIVFTDSLSSLQSISFSLVLQLLEIYNFLLQKGKTIVFCWIPSHMGIRGNKKVNSIAKTALNSDMSSFKVLYLISNSFSRKYIIIFSSLNATLQMVINYIKYNPL
ncbi:hypothetical protein BOW19_11565 [Solemya velum gill symbiont]|nr:hypothetical protein BOW19_11565 [Solemya velum gill symbiont]